MHTFFLACLERVCVHAHTLSHVYVVFAYTQALAIEPRGSWMLDLCPTSGLHTSPVLYFPLIICQLPEDIMRYFGLCVSGILTQLLQYHFYR